MLRFFFDGKGSAVFIKFYNTVFSRVSYIVAENNCSLFFLCTLVSIQKYSGEALSIEDIVSEDKCHCIIADKVSTDDERICQSSWLFLHCIFKSHAKLLTISEQFTKYRKVTWCGDDQDLTDSCKHQS